MAPEKVRRSLILAIAGCTNAGKSTLASVLVSKLRSQGCRAVSVGQDAFFKLKEDVRTIPSKLHPGVVHYDYDSGDALQEEKLKAEIEIQKMNNEFVVVELPSVLPLFHRIVFISIEREECRRRRDSRVYDPPDQPGYFDEVLKLDQHMLQIAWPAYEQHFTRVLKMAQTDRRISVFPCAELSADPLKAASMLLDAVFLNSLRISVLPLLVEEATDFVSSSVCGATALFLVVLLDYECYDAMAWKALAELCDKTRQNFPNVHKIVIHHRLGVVPVKESSVIIAASSPHRSDALEAVSFMIDELKRTVPIWKKVCLLIEYLQSLKERFADGDEEWKANSECCALKGHKIHCPSKEPKENNDLSSIWLTSLVSAQKP